MRITDATVIQDGEKELIDTIIGDLDWGAIENIFKEKHQLNIQDDVEYRQGDIVVHDNDVAYKLDFDVKVTLSILFDRSGNSVSIETSGDLGAESAPVEEGSDAENTATEVLPSVDVDPADESDLDTASVTEPAEDTSPEDIETVQPTEDGVAEMITDLDGELDEELEEEKV